MIKRPLGGKINGSKKGKGCLKGCLIIAAIPILLISGLIFFASLELRRSDKDILKKYQPSAEIADIAEKNMLTERGKATFYKADPRFVNTENFIKYCLIVVRRVESLACNVPKPGGGPFGGRQIFLLKVDDPKFADHKYSAAIHEMLHSAYNRLSSDERKNLNVLLDKELTKYKEDFHLMTVVEVLKEREGNDISDVQEELHSKFGVEYSGLSPELEDYYKLYFKDRRKVIELFMSGGFNSRVRKMDELAYETKTLNSKLTVMRDQLIAYQNAGDAASYNSLVPQFNSLVNQYNAKVAESKKIYAEVQQFYQYFQPDYQPPETITQ